MSRVDVLTALATLAGAELAPDELSALVKECLAADVTKRILPPLVDDPLCEEALGELDPEDRLELKELETEFLRQKTMNRRRVKRAARIIATARRKKAKAKAKPKPKAKANASGVAAAVAGIVGAVLVEYIVEPGRGGGPRFVVS